MFEHSSSSFILVNLIKRLSPSHSTAAFSSHPLSLSLSYTLILMNSISLNFPSSHFLSLVSKRGGTDVEFCLFSSLEFCILFDSVSFSFSPPLSFLDISFSLSLSHLCTHSSSSNHGRFMKWSFLSFDLSFYETFS